VRLVVEIIRYVSVMLGLDLSLMSMTTGLCLVGLGLSHEGCGIYPEGQRLGLGLGTHVRLVAGDTRVFEVH